MKSTILLMNAASVLVRMVIASDTLVSRRGLHLTVCSRVSIDINDVELNSLGCHQQYTQQDVYVSMVLIGLVAARIDCGWQL
jgi:hypothetical protein